MRFHLLQLLVLTLIAVVTITDAQSDDDGCGEGMVFSDCGSICPPACDDLNPDICEMECKVWYKISMDLDLIKYSCFGFISFIDLFIFLFYLFICLFWLWLITCKKCITAMPLLSFQKKISFQSFISLRLWDLPSLYFIPVKTLTH